MTAEEQGREEAGRRDAAFLQALTTEHFVLQGARALSASEIAARVSTYLTALSGALIALALVAQASHFGDQFYVFALVILPVVFFLGASAFGRILQNAVEFILYQREMARIRAYYREIDPARADLFREPADEVVLAELGIFRLRWQQFLSLATLVAVVEGVVGGAFVALVITRVWPLATWVAALIGGLVAAVILMVLLRLQWRAWKRVMAFSQKRADRPA